MEIFYVGVTKPSSSIDGVYIHGLRSRGVRVHELSLREVSGFRRYEKLLKEYLRIRKNIDFIIVGYDSPLLVIFFWIISRKKIIYNALCSVYERLIVSRELSPKISLKAWYYWLLDFLACRISSLTLLETEHQIQYFIKLFHLPKEKFFKAWIGAESRKFSHRPDMQKYETFTVLFRGRLLPEAGGEVAVEAAKFLDGENIRVLMLANGMRLSSVQELIRKLQPKNLELITEFLPDEKLLETMQKSHLSLGQLSAHERLERTIPHKAYESLALGLPYLTARNPGVFELLEEGKTCLAFTPADPKDLAQKILWAQRNWKETEEIGKNGLRLFEQELREEKLADKLLGELERIKR